MFRKGELSPFTSPPVKTHSLSGAISPVTLFHRSLTREFTAVGLAVAGVLLAIMGIQLLVRWLRSAAGGSIEPEAVMAMIGFSIVPVLPLVLALSLFVAVLVALSRSYRDSEMPVWFSSGLSLTAWVNPVMRFGVPIALVSSLISFWAAPWAMTESAAYQRMLSNRDDLARLAPGQFIERPGSSQVFFIDNTSSTSGAINNVFGHFSEATKFGVVVAETGTQETDTNGDKFLVLANGRRYEGTPGALDFRIIDFARQKIRIPQKMSAEAALETKSFSTLRLLREGTVAGMAELHWRLALPLAALILALVAIPLSFVNPRSGTSANVIIAIIIFFLYYAMLRVFDAWTVAGKVPVWVGLTPVHLVMVVLVLTLFSRELFSFRWLFFAKR